MKHTVLTPADREAILKAYQDGQKLISIALDWRIGHHLVLRIVHEAGGAFRRPLTVKRWK